MTAPFGSMDMQEIIASMRGNPQPRKRRPRHPSFPLPTLSTLNRLQTIPRTIDPDTGERLDRLDPLQTYSSLPDNSFTVIYN